MLANLESYNAILIEQKTDQPKRLELLRQTAVKQLTTISELEIPISNFSNLQTSTFTSLQVHTP